MRTALVIAALAAIVSSTVPADSKEARTFVESESECLAEALYYEAGAEGAAGMKAVAEVIFRRTQVRYYPGSVCGVVYQGAAVGRCAFSFTCDDMRVETRNQKLWATCKKLASQLMRDRKSLMKANATRGATHFHADRIKTNWEKRGLVRTATIGRHIFYRDPGVMTSAR